MDCEMPDIKPIKVKDITIEVFKGKLEKSAVSDCIKKEFSEREDIKEVVLLTKGTPEDLLEYLKKNLSDKLKFIIKVSEDFVVSYLIDINKNNSVDNVHIIISEGIERCLYNFIKENKFILRVVREDAEKSEPTDDRKGEISENEIL